MPCRWVGHAKQCCPYWPSLLEPRPPRAPSSAAGVRRCRPLTARFLRLPAPRGSQVCLPASPPAIAPLLVCPPLPGLLPHLPSLTLSPLSVLLPSPALCALRSRPLLSRVGLLGWGWGHSWLWVRISINPLWDSILWKAGRIRPGPGPPCAEPGRGIPRESRLG